MTIQPAERGFDVREKLLTQGAQRLSDTELLAVFISSGSAKRSCMQLAHDLIKHMGDMRSLLNTDLRDRPFLCFKCFVTANVKHIWSSF